MIDLGLCAHSAVSIQEGGTRDESRKQLLALYLITANNVNSSRKGKDFTVPKKQNIEKKKTLVSNAYDNWPYNKPAELYEKKYVGFRTKLQRLFF